MKRLYKIFISDKFLLIIYIFSTINYILLIGLNNFSFPFRLNRNDGYHLLFTDWISKSYYENVVEGTSILYNIFLKGIYNVVGNTDFSFVILNLISQLFILVIGIHILLKLKYKVKSLQFLIIITLYILYTLNLKSYHNSSNDTFLGVFVILIIYLITFKLNKEVKSKVFIYVAVLLSFSFSIRITAIFLLPLISVYFYTWFKTSNLTLLHKLRYLSIFFLSFLFVLTAFHYPSIINNKKLSYEIKDPINLNLNWTQRNYLGLKKIELGKEQLHRDAIWKYTKFEEVKKYVEINGENSLPKSMSEFILKDPILYLKISTYNVLNSLIRFIRFWGFLFLFTLYPLFYFRKNKASHKLLSSVSFIILIFLISFSCLTFIEFRWFFGYEILIPMGVLSFLNFNELKNKLNMNAIFASSLILVTLFNFRSIFSFVYN